MRNAGTARAGFNWRGWYTVFVCVVLYLLSSVDRQIINLLVEPIQAEFRVGDFEIGLLIGPAFGLCYALATFPLAWLADRMSRRLLLFCCVLVWASAACTSGLARDFHELFAARIIVGIGEAALLPTSYVLIAGRFERNRLALPLSILTLGAVGGLSVAMGLGAWLLQVGDRIAFPVLGQLPPWRAAFVLSGAPGFLLAFLILTVAREERHAALGSDHPDVHGLWRFIRKNRAIIVALLVGFGLLQVVSGAIVGWFPTHLIRTYGWTASQAGATLAMTTLVVASLGKLIAGISVDWLFRHGRSDAHFRYAVVTAALALPFLVGATIAPAPMIAVALIAFYFIGPYSSVGYGSAFVQLFSPVVLRGRVSGLYLLVCNLFAMAGPVVVGAMTDRVFADKSKLGTSLGIVTSVAMLLAIAFLAFAMPRVRAALREAH